MAKTFKELKEISQGLADQYGITYDAAARVVASFSAVGEWSSVDKIKDGDKETIKEGFTRAGVPCPDSKEIKNGSRATASGSVCTDTKGVKAENKPEKVKTDKMPVKDKKTVKKENKAVKITPQAVEGVRVYSDALEDYRRGELPETLTDDIKTLLQAWAQDNGFEDLTKLANIQWSSACLWVGQWFKSNKILHDIERERTEGGRRYDGEKIAALIPIWQYITGLYKHIPLHCDFISFTGVHRNYFYDYDGRGLTSSSVQIVKKVMDIENAAISVGVTDSRENPTGRIFYAKARLGWREADQVQQIGDSSGASSVALPIYDSINGGLIAQKP